MVYKTLHIRGGKLIKKWVSRITTTLLAVLLIIMIVAVISSKATGGEPNFFGYQLKTVLSGSMEPTFQTGSIIAVNPNKDMTQLQEGDVIVFMNEEKLLITHRIIEVITNNSGVMYRTMGDNNDGPDAGVVIPENITAVYTGFTIPYAGYVFSFATSKMGTVLLLIIPGFLLLSYSVISTWRAIAQLDLKKEAEVSSSEQV